jgi:uncharacterized protein with von Willebrand factor type A (vWA) domain
MGDLTRDIFYSYHHPREPEVLARARWTRRSRTTRRSPQDDGRGRPRAVAEHHPRQATAAAIATMAASARAEGSAGDELIEQARQSEEFEQAREQAEGAMDQLESLREQARERTRQGQPVPQELVDQIKQGVQDKRAAGSRPREIALASPGAVRQGRARSGRRRRSAGGKEAARTREHPELRSGLRRGRAALRVARAGADHRGHVGEQRDPARVAELYGRLDKDMRFKRAKRVVGGQDEIVDLKFGDDIRRILPSELALARGRGLRGRLLHALPRRRAARVRHRGRGARRARSHRPGRGRVGSMSGERNVWAKALACAC